jgi:hypothetical protein
MPTGDREYKSDFARGYYSEGQAKMILTVFSGRGIAVPESAQIRITECTDLEQLEEWGRRAITAESVDDLFD